MSTEVTSERIRQLYAADVSAPKNLDVSRDTATDTLAVQVEGQPVNFDRKPSDIGLEYIANWHATGHEELHITAYYITVTSEGPSMRLHDVSINLRRQKFPR